MENRNFMAKISAIISNFERNVRKAQRLAKTAIPNEIETDITANTNKFQRAIQKAKAMAQKWRSHKVDVNANTTQFTRAVAFSKAKLATWRKHTVKLNFDTSGMTKAQIAMTTISKMTEEYQNKMDKLASNIRTFGTIFSQQVKGVMIASFQALIPVIAGIVPVIFAVLNAIKALSGGVVAFAGAGAIAFGGLLAYALMAKSAIKMLNDGTIQASSATKKYQSALKGVKDEWQGIVKQNATAIFQSMANGLNTVKTALSSLKPFFKGVADGVNQASKKMLEWAKNSQVAQRFFKMMNTTGVSVFNKLLSAAGRFGDGLINVFTQLAPLFQWSANWMNRLGASFQKWANSAAGKNSIKQFMEYTKTNLPIIGNIFKNVFSGIFNLMNAFGTNSTRIFSYLETMSAKFKAWSETVGKSQGFKKFIEYVQKNGPVIMQLIGNIVRALVAFGVAMAPIASVLLRVITAIAGFVAKLFETHPAIARVIGVMAILGGIFWALMAPIMAVGTVLSNVFGVSLLSVAKHILGFIKNAGLLRGILNLVKGAFTLLMSPIANIVKLLPILSGALTALTGPVGIVIGVILALVGIIVYLWNTNEQFRNFIIQAWNSLKEAIGGAIQGIIGWFQQLLGSVMATLQPIMPILQILGQVFNQVFGTVIMTVISQVIIAFQALWAGIQIAAQLIGLAIQILVQTVVGLFTAFIQFITGDFGGAWLTLKNMVVQNTTAIWNTLVNIWGIITGFLSGALNTILGIFGTSWQQIWATVSSKVSQIWSTITSRFSALVGSIAGFVAQWAARILVGMAQMVAHAVSGMIRFGASIISGFVSAVASVGSGVSNMVSKALNFIGQFKQAGTDLIQGLVDGVVNMAGRLVSAVEGVVGGAIAAAKNLLNQHSPSKVFEEIGMYTMQGFINGINGQGGAVVKNMRHLMQDATDAFNPNVSLDTDLTKGLDSSMTGNVDSHMTKDVRHSMQENTRPIVNVQVRNEGDIEFIKSTIEDMNSRDGIMIT
ncbi:phage tail protein [Staphylococcus xylosus]